MADVLAPGSNYWSKCTAGCEVGLGSSSPATWAGCRAHGPLDALYHPTQSGGRWPPWLATTPGMLQGLPSWHSTAEVGSLFPPGSRQCGNGSQQAPAGHGDGPGGREYPEAGQPPSDN
ncbi:hypothetical protein GHT09_014146 [Marmota monax]|uniref:Uncharacterized protein n=1 Tax=Marmota monax TaxID=9995 RepID=A0A834UK82_MARMO|nr:hypothetical protein GHT09_014146 [Marmota monax]